MSTLDTKAEPGAEEAIQAFFLSPQQKSLWVAQPNEGRSACRSEWGVLLEGPLQPDRLRAALAEAISRHESLRTVFRRQAAMKVPFQVVLGLSEALWEMREPAAGDFSEDLCRWYAAREFDLENGPLVHASLSRISPERHILSIAVPALCGDSRSLANLVSDIGKCYAGRQDQLAEEPLRYVQFSQWQEDLLESSEDAAVNGKEFWKQQHVSGEKSLVLHGELTRDESLFRPEHLKLALPPSVSAQIDLAAEQCAASVSDVLLAAWECLLSRLTGSARFGIGVILDGREYEELGDAVGLIAKTVPVHCAIETDFTFKEVVASTREAQAQAVSWQEYFTPGTGFGSESPVVFQFDAVPEKREFGNISFCVEHQCACLESFRLKLHCMRSERGLNVEFHYDAARLPLQTVQRIAEHFEVLLKAALSNPEIVVSRLPLLSERQLQQVTVEWNQTAAAYPSQQCVQQLFEAQVKRTPERTAVVGEDGALTYAELNRQANRLAHYLNGLGVGPDCPVGLCVERSSRMMVGLLAILKAGGAYVPLNAEHPKPRLAQQIVGAAALLTERRFMAQMPETDIPLLCIDSDQETWAAEPDGNPEVCTAPENLVYVIYTSGSTGTPKGVAVTHGNLVNYAWFIRGRLELERENEGLQFATVSTLGADLGNTCIFPALLTGGCLHVLSYEVATDSQRFAAYQRQRPIDVLKIVPGHLAALLNSAEAAQLLPRKYLVMGGETLSARLVEKILALGGTCQVMNHYGPTETTVGSLTLKLAEYDWRHAAAASIPIGRPIANTQIYILDGEGQPVPVGVVGDLHIGGAGVTRGYLNQPQLTAERFVPNRFSGGRLYKTGDLARYLAGGEVEFLGRGDDQVKVRGFRIELGEIEAVLARHPAVRQAVLLAREGETGEKQLVAYVVTNRAAGVDVPELRNHLREQLPDYMVPSAIVLLDKLPLTSNGKVDRAALPLPENEQSGTIHAYIAPRTPAEEVVAGIWMELLRLPQVGAQDNFFELGGHSLLATQVISRIRQSFQVELPLRVLFEVPTVADMAARIELFQRQKHGLEAPPIRAVPRDIPLPLSFAQRRLWFLNQLDPDSPIYNVPRVVRLRGNLNCGALEQTIREIVRRHEILRTVFRMEGSEPVQIIAPRIDIFLEVPDFASLPREEREAQVRGLAEDLCRRPFDLSQGPLFRASLLRLDADDHVLVLNTHHIASDGWSRGILWREVTALYQAYMEGQPSPLPELPIQYADYAVWQREFLSGERLDRQLTYWKQQLGTAPASLELPTDRQRPPVQTFTGALHSALLPKTLLDRLKDLSRSESATLFMTVLAAFNVLLARYSGQEDIVVGSPIAGRNLREVENLIGFFINTLVLRTDLAGAPNFRELLGRVRETAMNAYAHQDLPFEKLVEELNPVRDLSRSPLFQVMFMFQNAPASTPSMPGLDIGGFARSGETSKFDLTLAVAESPEGLRATFEYNTGLFDGATIECMMHHFEVVLGAIAANSSLPIIEMPLLAGEERGQILRERNETAAKYPDVCVHQLIEARVERTPDSRAVVCNGEEITYAELNLRANQLARHLRTLGVGPEYLVGLCLERSTEMLVAMLAVHKAGGAYVPLDPSFPVERLAFMLSDSASAVLVTQQELAGLLPSHAGVVVCIDRDWEAVSRHQSGNLDSGFSSPENLAYVRYTSGSTGRPKGVMVPHRGVVNFLESMRREPGISNEDVLLAVTTLSFDISELELWLPLCSGGTVVLASREMSADGRQLTQLLEDFAVTVMQATPATWRMLIDAGWVGTPNLKVLCGGEALSPSLAAELLPRCAQLWNMYGPTETTIWSATSRVQTPGAIFLGDPIANTQLYILDRYLQPVPVGVAGELCIGGDGLARGYLNRPELSAEKFVVSPFDGSARLYRTGDLVRRRRNGQIEFLGRIDNQVKIRGYRIELGEIESQIAEFPGLAEAVVVAREDVPQEKRLVAYLVAREGAVPVPRDLRPFLKQKLPDYMIPSAFVTLERLPLSPSGKVDRKALPAPELKRSDLDGDSLVERTPAEEVLAGIWAEVLRQEPPDVQDNFFELGGHSLLATQVVSRIRQAFQVELPLRFFFETPTVAGLAQRLEALQRERQGLVTLPMERIPRENPLPLSFAQQRLWFLDQLEPGNTLYGVPNVLRLRGNLDIPALERAIAQIIDRHEVLRTTFRLENGEPVQVIAPNAAAPLEIIDVTDMPETERETEARKRVAAEVRCPFNLSAGPLFRSSLVRISDLDHVLVFNMHHTVSDGWSHGVLWRELVSLYSDFVAGLPATLPELPVQYADFAVWQRKFLSGETLEKQLEYWKRQLAGAPPSLDLPADRPRPPQQTFHGARETMVVSPASLAALKLLSRQDGATLFMTLLAAFSVLLSRYSGQDDIVVGSPIAGRNRAEIENLIGLFVNTLALRTDLSGAPSFADLLRRVREATMGAYAHQDLPFERLVEELQPQRDLSRNPIFQVLFSLQNMPGAGRALPGLEPEVFSAAYRQTSKFDLSLYLMEAPDGLRTTFEYNTGLFESATIGRMQDHWRSLLEAVVSDPHQSVTEVPLLDPAERQQLLVEWNATAAEFPRDICVHQLFERQVERTPESVAVRYGDSAFSYSQLNERANRLAKHLRQIGAGPGTLAGIALDRSAEMLVAMLAIHKAGAAYVPLDLSFPRERLADMCEDSGLAILISQQSALALLPAHSAQVVDIDGDGAAIAAHDAGNLDIATTPEDLAYVRYTSGSTGRPKGVVIPHRAVVNFLESMRREPGLDSNDSLLAVTTLSFDISELELWLPLCAGACVTVANREDALDGQRLAQLLRDSGITAMQATPATWQMLVDSGWKGNPQLKILCGGEALSPALAQLLLERGASVWNMYGPTETTIWSAVTRVEAGKEISLGHPIANTQLYILDRNRQVVPIGVAGELCIAGEGLAHGYWKRLELTDEKFIEVQFDGVATRLYRTGDLARYRSNGEIEFIGRIDHQVKIRGFRIELGEIEAQLSQQPGVQQAVALVREDNPGDKRLVAYVVPGSGGSVDAEDLRAALKQKLPDYMLPAAFVLLTELPLTPNGKVDRKALPAPEKPASSRTGSLGALSALEVRLTEIFEGVLNLRPVGADDDFFQLGGHSLMAVQLISRIREIFGPEIPLNALFRASTVRSLARLLNEESANAVMPVLIPIRATGSRSPLFCVSRPNTNALGFLFLSRHLHDEQPVYGLQSTAAEDGRNWTYSEEDYREKAREYISAMRQVQPNGPYFLTGFCEGAHIAFEMARQLEAMNLEVGMISILDAWPVENTISRSRIRIRNLGLSLYRISKMDGAAKWAFFKRKLGLHAARPSGNGKVASAETTQHTIAVQRAIERYWPGPDWKPGTYSGKLVLFRTDNQPFHRIRDRKMGWGIRALGGVEVIRIPGKHWLILREPNVQVLADKIQACIDRALSVTPKPPGSQAEQYAAISTGR